MSPIVFTSPDTAQFAQVTNLFRKSINIIAVVGAGMSTSCGIPAFRGGPDGIYSKYGKYVFDYIQVHSDQAIGRKYLQMIGDMKAMLETTAPSPTHQFLKILADSGRLRRIYTQNIDDLETKAGLKRVSALSDFQLEHKVVQLHGHLRKLYCGVCHFRTKFTTDLAKRFQTEKSDIACPSCEENNRERGTQKRQRPVGKLQTFVVLQNGGPNPDGQLISQIFDIDVASSPDLLLIIGTSLEIRAIRSFVTRLVNKNVPSLLMDFQEVEFSGFQKLTFHLKGPCDLFATFLMKNVADWNTSCTYYNNDLNSNDSDDSDMVLNFEPLHLSSFSNTTHRGAEPSAVKTRHILKICDHCFIRKINCTWSEESCDFCRKNGKYCTTTIKSNSAAAIPRKRKCISEPFLYRAKVLTKPKSISSLYCFPARPDPILFFQTEDLGGQTNSYVKSCEKFKVKDFTDHDQLSFLGRTFSNYNPSASVVSLNHFSFNFGGISTRQLLCDDLQAFRTCFSRSSSLEKEKTKLEIQNLHEQCFNKIYTIFQKEALFCHLSFSVFRGKFLVCRIAFLSNCMQSYNFNLFSIPMDPSSQFIDTISKQMDMLGIIGKLSGIFVSDFKLKNVIFQIVDKLSRKNSRIQIHFSLNYHFQELFHTIENWYAKLSVGIQELQFSYEILQKYKLIMRVSQSDSPKYSSFSQFISILNELLGCTFSISEPYKDASNLNGSLKRLVDRLISKIKEYQQSYQNSSYFAGGLLDPSVKNRSNIYGNYHPSDLKELLIETCEKEWNHINHICFTVHEFRGRLPTDHKLTIREEVERYWKEMDSLIIHSSKLLWKEYETKFPRLFILARKLLDFYSFAELAPDLDIDDFVEIPVGKILDLNSWKDLIDLV